MLVLVGVMGRRSPLLGRAAPCFTAGGGGVEVEEEERRLEAKDSGLFLFLKYEVLLNCAFNAKKLRRKIGTRQWLSVFRLEMDRFLKGKSVSASRVKSRIWIRITVKSLKVELLDKFSSLRYLQCIQDIHQGLLL
jgi:hypothetical protein